ncbi:hypothetical protein B5181_31755, partial [Streptomyces sp. 4F]
MAWGGGGRRKFSASDRRHVRGSGGAPPWTRPSVRRTPSHGDRPTQGPCRRTGDAAPEVPRAPGAERADRATARRDDGTPRSEGVATHHADPRQREAPARRRPR